MDEEPRDRDGRPIVYLYSLQADPAGNPDDFGWWFQCWNCPSLWDERFGASVGGVDEGPFTTAAAANDSARLHITTTTHQTQE